ncbi:hypothetical protein QFC21_002474 [Naganishia friedmannii]|uniref:Uncharacterized protein n=1 Tax=Naganishia friedmannii TaxID=89922 RepID=A0ACC2VXB6_9TREE|nr:hypothetical protein QFC21_002474 [Naganishia friedmannii]
MASLVADYTSSDDESTAVAPTAAVSTTTRPSADDEDLDDEAAEEKARGDLFGLTDAQVVERSDAVVGHLGAAAGDGVSAAPDVLAEDPNAPTTMITRPTDKVMNVNLTYDDMMRPTLGPENPYDTRKNKGMNSVAGHVEEQSMDASTFLQQHRTFSVHGYALNPSALTEFIPQDQIVGDMTAASSHNFAMIDNLKGTHASRRELKRRRQATGDPSVVDGEGAYVGPWGAWQGDEDVNVELEEDMDEWRAEKRRRDDESAAAKERLKKAGEEKSIFHGKSLTDYAGRTYMHIPTDLGINLRPSEETPAPESFIPQACTHTWTGHTKAVSAIRLFPQSGHLLLSGSMDTKVKLWDVYHEGNCLRTFMGHTKAIKDVNFNNDGTRFLSASYDRQIKLWDTETGQCIQAFSNGKIPNVVKFNPDEDKQHVFLAGMSDKKIIQYDLRTREIVQEYDQHLGPVNTITFVDENRRFVTTSDDKTIRAWDYDIPVVIKYIAEPYMHSMPAVTLHPNNKWFAAQSLDNQILIYSTDGFRQNRKKRFAGHTVAGYACAIGFSPDGRFISSGDGEGNVVFWDWKNGKILKRLRAHKQVVIDHVWLPHQHSKLITASWDGLIKLWE